MKIFISSTYEDLKEHRRAVIDAILQLRHQPIAMEFFGAHPGEPKFAALAEINDCDALVGIYAYRYGWVPDGDPRSITEQEFDYARERSKPCFCYRVQKDFDWDAKFKETGAEAERLKNFLDKLGKLVLWKEFTTPDDLAKKVIADLGRELKVGFTLASALHSLPTAPADFTGREYELEQLLSSATQHSSLISSLSGMGGVGKTALALVAAHQLAEKFPDAQIYLDLKGTTTPLSPRDAMQFVIHAFDPQADLRQVSAEEIAALYRTLLSDKRALLLFDNAADAAQVKPLIPPPTCGLLVTSRKHFTLAGLQPIRLDVMSESEARDLLLKLAPRIGAHADEIARLCGYLPLALEITAGFIAEHGDVAVETYAARLNVRKGKRIGLLKKQDEPDLNVEAAFALSYDQLTDENRARWRALAVFTAPFDVSAAASVWEMEEQGTQEILSEFFRVNILQFDENKRRYQLHDLLQEFADARLSKSERETAQLQHAIYYFEIGRVADEIYLQGKVMEGLALFDLEWENIKAGQAWAEKSLETNEAATKLCKDFPIASSNCLGLRLTDTEKMKWLHSGIGAARKLNDRYVEGANLDALALTYWSVGEPGKAIEYYEQALAIARVLGNKVVQGITLGNLGLAYRDLGNPHKAIELQEQALILARDIGDKRSEGNHLGNLGSAYFALGETRKAIEFYEQSLSITRDIGDARGEGADLGNLGSAYFALGETRKAIEFFGQALVIAHDIGDKPNEGYWLGNLGGAYHSLGNVHKAMEFYEKALAIHRNFGDKRGEGTDLFNLGLAHEELGNREKAIQCTEYALKIYEAIESPDIESTLKRLEELKASEQ